MIITQNLHSQDLLANDHVLVEQGTTSLRDPDKHLKPLQYFLLSDCIIFAKKEKKKLLLKGKFELKSSIIRELPNDAGNLPNFGCYNSELDQHLNNAWEISSDGVTLTFQEEAKEVKDRMLLAIQKVTQTQKPKK